LPDISAPTRLRAGGCLIDLDAGVLLDESGQPLALRPRAWQVLRHLAERAGRLVSKDELIAAIWPGGIITDNSLVQAVADARRALGALGGQALRTVPRRGYLLVATAEEAGPAGAAQVIGTLGDRLREQAARRFVGREAELELLRPAVGREMPAQALSFVHGPGGMGKSMLLERLRRMAEPGVAVVSVDGAELLPTPQGIVEGIGIALGLTERSITADGVAAAWAARGRCVLLLDTFEALDPVQGWMRDTWLPALPAGVTVVLAGRRAPDSRWSAHPLWVSAMRAVALGMLETSACARLARAHGVPAALCGELAERSHGLPLAAVMLAVEANRTGRLPDELGGEVVRALTRRCLDQAPSPAHREALLACALARRATRALLAHLFGREPAEALFDWLAAQGYVGASRDGLRLHDLMREALLADTTWCDRERLRALRRAVIRFLAARLGPGRDAWDATVDFFYARRHSEGFRRFHDVEGLARVGTSVGTEVDLPEVLAFGRQHLPAAEHDAFARWTVHPAATVVVARTEGGAICGIAIELRMGALGNDDIASDPVISSARQAIGAAWNEPSKDSYSLFVRHWVASGDTSRPNPGLTALMAHTNPIFADPDLRLFCLWAPIPPYLAPMWPELGFRIEPDCARLRDGIGHELLVRDWRAEPWAAWIRRVVGPAPEQAETAAAPDGVMA
jgi:DNA-binding winged helix-turn-helix (wHTH) protein